MKARRWGKEVQTFLEDFILHTASKQGSKYAYCKLCSSNFVVSYGRFNDIKRHVEGL